MAKHEFGIMETPPKPHTRYDSYEPQKYNCIEVDDEYIEVIDGKLDADMYWHTLDVKPKRIEPLSPRKALFGLNIPLSLGIHKVFPRSAGIFILKNHLSSVRGKFHLGNFCS